MTLSRVRFEPLYSNSDLFAAKNGLPIFNFGDHDIINPAAMCVSAQHGAGNVELGDQLVSVIMVPRHNTAGAGAFEQAAKRFVPQRCGARSAGHGDKAVLDIIGVAVRAIRGQVAVRVIGKGRRTSAGVLVEAVDRVVARHRDIAGIVNKNPIALSLSKGAGGLRYDL